MEAKKLSQASNKDDWQEVPVDDWQEIPSGSQAGAAALGSAKAAFEQGQPTAYFQPNEPNPAAQAIQNTGLSDLGKIYKNPVSPLKTFGQQVLSEAGTVPTLSSNFPYIGTTSLTEKAQTMLPGQSKDQIQQTKALGAEQNPAASGLGELVGTGLNWLTGEELFKAGGASIKALAPLGESIGTSVKDTLAAMESSSAAKGTAKIINTLVPEALLPKNIKQWSSAISDRGLLATERTREYAYKQGTKFLKAAGTALENNWAEVQKVIPKDLLQTPNELAVDIANAYQDSKRAVGSLPVQGYKEKVMDIVKKYFANAKGPINLATLQRVSGEMQDAFKVFKDSGDDIKLGKEVTGLVRQKLYSYAETASKYFNDDTLFKDIANNAKLYGQIKQGQAVLEAARRPELKVDKVNTMIERGAEIMSQGKEKLGKFWPRFLAASNRGLAAVNRLHNYLTLSDPQYQQLQEGNQSPQPGP